MNNSIENENSSGYVCGECGASVSITDTICSKCGADVSEIKEGIQEGQIKMEDKDKTKYPALKLISGVYKLLAHLTAIISILISVFYILNNNGEYIIPIITIISGGILVITFFAISEIILIFIDIEKNTRDVEKNTRTFKSEG